MKTFIMSLIFLLITSITHADDTLWSWEQDGYEVDKSTTFHGGGNGTLNPTSPEIYDSTSKDPATVVVQVTPEPTSPYKAGVVASGSFSLGAGGYNLFDAKRIVSQQMDGMSISYHKPCGYSSAAHHCSQYRITFNPPLSRAPLILYNVANSGGNGRQYCKPVPFSSIHTREIEVSDVTKNGCIISVGAYWRHGNYVSSYCPGRNAPSPEYRLIVFN